MGREGLVHEESAGGIVFYGPKVLVLSNHRGDVVFPKGHLEVGETNEQSALREVAEEAGVHPRIVCDLGTTEYEFYWFKDRNYRHKTVYWFLMEAESEELQVDRVEIMSGEYVPVEDAARRLTYELDRKKLQEAVQRRAEWRGESVGS